nr:flocculation protein FLO11-like [Procambarus clarkii]
MSPPKYGYRFTAKTESCTVGDEVKAVRARRRRAEERQARLKKRSHHWIYRDEATDGQETQFRVEIYGRNTEEQSGEQHLIVSSHGEPTPPTSHGEPTPPTSHGEPTPPTSHGEPTPPTSHGEPTPPTSHGEPTPPTSHGEPTPPTSHGEPTPPTSHGEPTPPKMIQDTFTFCNKVMKLVDDFRSCYQDGSFPSHNLG